MKMSFSILVLIALSFAGGAVAARAQDQPAPTAAPPQQPAQQPANPPAPGGTPDGKQGQEPGKPPAKKPRVINNEDLEGKGGILFPQTGRSAIDLGGINDCDRNCFERVRSQAGIAAGTNLQWKHDLLQSIEKVREDAKWQATLAELARIKGEYCDLEAEKNEELAKRADPKNVTEAELSIDEEYQRKFQAVEQELMKAFADADAAMRDYRGIIVPFLGIQRQRIVNATCYQTPAPRYIAPTDDSDDQ